MKALEKYTPEELADSFVFGNSLNAAEKAQLSAELAHARSQRRSDLSPPEELQLKLLQLRYQLEDYLSGDDYDEERNLGYFLRKYIRLGYKTIKAFAYDLHIDETELSQVLNGHRKPTDKLLYRIEIHSAGIISALNLRRLSEREKEQEFLHNNLVREEQAQYVRRSLLDSRNEDSEPSK